jgi:hypothetical protein
LAATAGDGLLTGAGFDGVIAAGAGAAAGAGSAAIGACAGAVCTTGAGSAGLFLLTTNQATPAATSAPAANPRSAFIIIGSGSGIPDPYSVERIGDGFRFALRPIE